MCQWNNYEKEMRILLIQVFDGDIFQIFDSFFADDLDLEIG